VICEKPIALNAGEARQMLDAARVSNVRHMVAFNYRRVPAIALARQMIQEGKIGRVFHFNAVYYQDWLVDPEFPYVWRHDKKVGGSGAHGDMNAHTVDLARFLVGEIESVCGTEEVFIKGATAAGKARVRGPSPPMMPCSSCPVSWGALRARSWPPASPAGAELSPAGNRGGEGSLIFNLERLNELE
jgi:predicted dehydrogenase